MENFLFHSNEKPQEKHLRKWYWISSVLVWIKSKKISNSESLLTLLLLCFFLLTEGDPGCPGLGTELDPADVGPEWTWDPFSTTEDRTSGDCCRETFWSSAANCLGSTPGDFALSTITKRSGYVSQFHRCSIPRSLCKF